MVIEDPKYCIILTVAYQVATQSYEIKVETNIIKQPDYDEDALFEQDINLDDSGEGEVNWGKVIFMLQSANYDKLNSNGTNLMLDRRNPAENKIKLVWTKSGEFIFDSTLCMDLTKTILESVTESGQEIVLKGLDMSPDML